MSQETIEINIHAFCSAVEEAITAERFATDMVKRSSNNNDMLTLACMTFAINQDLIGYLDDENRYKVKKFMSMKEV